MGNSRTDGCHRSRTLPRTHATTDGHSHGRTPSRTNPRKEVCDQGRTPTCWFVTRPRKRARCPLVCRRLSTRLRTSCSCSHCAMPPRENAHATAQTLETSFLKRFSRSTSALHCIRGNTVNVLRGQECQVLKYVVVVISFGILHTTNASNTILLIQRISSKRTSNNKFSLWAVVRAI